jgi:polyribonucleotide nucleotidyltransferase
LDESDASFIAQKIKGLDQTEEAFASLKSELEVFWSAKNKENKAKFEAEVRAKVEEEVAKRLATASKIDEETDVEEALEEAEETTSRIPNNNEAQASESKSLRDRFAAAFSRENILS